MARVHTDAKTRASETLFTPRVRRGIVGAVGLSALATVAIILFSRDLSTPRALPRDSYTYGSLGHRAFVETLEALGHHVMRGRRGNLSAHRSPVFFLEPDATVVHFDDLRLRLDTILDERAVWDRPSVVVLPKWGWSDGPIPLAVPDTELATDIAHSLFPDATLVYREPLMDEGEHTLVGPLGRYEVSLPRLQLLKVPADSVWPETQVLLGDGDDAAILRRDDGVIVVTDSDLVHSWALTRADHAQIWVDLLRNELHTDTLVVDEVFHGQGRTLSLGQAMGELPAALLTAGVLLLLLLLLLAGLRRFGPATNVSALGHGPHESIDVAAFVLAEGKSLLSLARGYIAEVLHDLGRQLDLEHGRTLNDLAVAIDRRAKRRGVEGSAADLLRELTDLEAQRKPSPTTVLALAQRAHTMRSNLLRSPKRR